VVIPQVMVRVFRIGADADFHFGVDFDLDTTKRVRFGPVGPLPLIPACLAARGFHLRSGFAALTRLAAVADWATALLMVCRISIHLRAARKGELVL
jgi:hypothetical protein